MLASPCYAALFLLIMSLSGTIFPKHIYYVIPAFRFIALHVGNLLDHELMSRRTTVLTAIEQSCDPVSVTLIDAGLNPRIEPVRSRPVLPLVTNRRSG